MLFLGIEPRTTASRAYVNSYKSGALPTELKEQKMPLLGIEPRTFCLQDRCSTTEPKRLGTPSVGLEPTIFRLEGGRVIQLRY